MNEPTPDAIRRDVRERYGAIARRGTCGCDCGEPSAGAPESYAAAELAAVPSGADLGLGCGHPGALADLRPGDVVLDLGSGGGIDCFLAARRVGEEGRVIGVDMTPGMIERARSAARTAGVANVEFRLGEIERLPVADASVDVVLSNCVINLSPDKAAVFREAYRVLRPGGRLAVSDIVAVAELPPDVRNDPAQRAACVAGALPPAGNERLLRDAGFADVRVEVGAPGGDAPWVAPASITARRPAGDTPAA